MSLSRSAWPEKIQEEIEERLRDLAEIVEPETVVEYVERLAERLREDLEAA